MLSVAIQLGNCGRSSIAFGNQTISPCDRGKCPRSAFETHGFASLPRGKFAFIVCNLNLKDQATFAPGGLTQQQTDLTVQRIVCQQFCNRVDSLFDFFWSFDFSAGVLGQCGQ